MTLGHMQQVLLALHPVSPVITATFITPPLLLPVPTGSGFLLSLGVMPSLEHNSRNRSLKQTLSR